MTVLKDNMSQHNYKTKKKNKKQNKTIQKKKTEEGIAPGTACIQAIGLLKTVSYVEGNIMKQRTQA
jgi:hypothetical protein